MYSGPSVRTDTPPARFVYIKTPFLLLYFKQDYYFYIYFLLFSTMSSGKRLFACAACNGSSCSKSRRPNAYGTPVFPSGIRATSLNSESLDTSQTVSTPPDEISHSLWTCPICLGIPRVPAQISKCGHIGCMSCFLEHLRASGVTRNGWEQRVMARCPYCRVDFAEDNLKLFSTWQPLSKAVLGLVKVRCRLDASTNGVTCSWTGSVMNLLHHETYECPARRIVCPNLYCKYTDTESEVKAHFGRCILLRVRCMECGLPTSWVSRNTHDCNQALKAALRGKSLTIIRNQSE